jgi:hypothetical protein
MQTHSDYYGTENEDDEPASDDRSVEQQSTLAHTETSKPAATAKEQP